MSELQASGQELLELLAKAKDDNGTVDHAGLPVPDLAGAYAVQAAFFQRGGHALVGFKLSLRSGTAYSCPLLFVEGGTDYAHIPGIGVEPELALTLSRDLPARDTPYTRADILDAIGKVSLGVEIIRSRFVTPPTWPMPLADFMSNIGYLVGVEFPRSILDEGAALGVVSVQADGASLFEGPAKHPDGDPVAALIAYANGTPGQLGTLKAGQVITTGSVCGAIKVPQPSAVTVTLAGKEYGLKLS